MSEKTEIADGATVTFKVGRAGTSYEATVTGREGMFLLTKDAAGKERKVRPGACSVK